MRPDDLPRVRAHHSRRADREALESAYRAENRIFLVCLAASLLVAAWASGDLQWCLQAALAWWGAR